MRDGVEGSTRIREDEQSMGLIGEVGEVISFGAVKCGAQRSPASYYDTTMGRSRGYIDLVQSTSMLTGSWVIVWQGSCPFWSAWRGMGYVANASASSWGLNGVPQA